MGVRVSENLGDGHRMVPGSTHSGDLGGIAHAVPSQPSWALLVDLKHGSPQPPPPEVGPPGDLWSEGGDVLWIHRDRASSAERAKRIAFTGRGLPETFLGGDRYGYDLLTVSQDILRPGEFEEEGWAGSGPDTWWQCDPSHPKAEPFWRIECKP